MQDSLETTSISSKGVRMDCEWVEVADIVNATVDRRQRLLAGHRMIWILRVNCPLSMLTPSCLNKH